MLAQPSGAGIQSQGLEATDAHQEVMGSHPGPQPASRLWTHEQE